MFETNFLTPKLFQTVFLVSVTVHTLKYRNVVMQTILIWHFSTNNDYYILYSKFIIFLQIQKLICFRVDPSPLMIKDPAFTSLNF